MEKRSQNTFSAYNIQPIEAEQITKVAAIFREAFAESLAHFFGRKGTTDRAIIDLFSFLSDVEPDNFLVAVESDLGEEKSEVLGYIVAPYRMGSCWYRAVVGGYLFRWIVRWMRGEYGFGLRPVPSLLHNKLGFLRFTAGLSFRRSRQMAQILSLAVARSARGRGIGTALLSAALERIREEGKRPIKLEVREDNESARRLYEKFDFEKVAEWSDTQGRWLVMIREPDAE